MDVNVETYKEFTFEAAHHLPNQFPEGHENFRLHGHSFRVRIWFAGKPDPDTKMLVDFGELSRKVSSIRESLDHRYLNEVEGLEEPTLEAIAYWIFEKASTALECVSSVEIHRDTCFEGCKVSRGAT